MIRKQLIEILLCEIRRRHFLQCKNETAKTSFFSNFDLLFESELFAAA